MVNNACEEIRLFGLSQTKSKKSKIRIITKTNKSQNIAKFILHLKKSEQS